MRPLADLGRQIDYAQRWIRFVAVASVFNPRRIPLLNSGVFDGKRVIIIGPAATVFDDLKGVVVDDFDIVVRMNNGVWLKNSNPTLGTRTDVLFHNLVEDGDRSAGEIAPHFLIENEVRTCVFPHWAFKGSKTRLYEKRKLLLDYPSISLRVPPRRFCEDVRRRLGGKQPTVGASAVLFFLGCQLRELQIHGLTFSPTPYVAGYNDEVRTVEDAGEWVMASPVHNPAIERLVISEAVDNARSRGLNVRLGRNVEYHLHRGD